jgi:hypothetical protein
MHSWSSQWKWENAAAGAVAGLTTVVALHPLDIVRTRFQGLQREILLLLFLFFHTNIPKMKKIPIQP